MEQLAANAVVTRRFDDASFFFYKLAQDSVQHGPLIKGGEVPPPLTDEEAARRVQRHDSLMRRAELYYAYQHIHKFASQPYPTTQPLTLFNCARYLVATLTEFPDIPMNISKLEVLLTLGRLATTLDMHRMARQIHEKLQQFVLPTPIMEQLDVATLRCTLPWTPFCVNLWRARSAIVSAASNAATVASRTTCPLGGRRSASRDGRTSKKTTLCQLRTNACPKLGGHLHGHTHHCARCGAWTQRDNHGNSMVEHAFRCPRVRNKRRQFHVRDIVDLWRRPRACIDYIREAFFEYRVLSPYDPP